MTRSWTHTSWRALLAAFALVVVGAASAGASTFASNRVGYLDGPELPLQRGDSGNDVEALQSLLASAGHSPGQVDGVFGPMTESAVLSFQSAHDLPATGVVDQATWDALEASVPVILLERGDRGAEVRSLQQLLAAAGFDPGPIDGIFGSMTELAVVLFQTDRSLAATGTVDQATWDALNADPPTILLERGDTGDQVRTLQLLLATAGHNPGPIDGIFGGLTEASVVAFQNAAGLAVTGWVDQATWDALSDIPTVPDTLLERGDTGPQVEALQDQLAAVGFDPGPIDGIFGPKTELAVSRFNSIHGLPGDSAVTQETLDKLAELRPLADSAYDYGYDPNASPEQWRDLITEVFARWGLDQEACGEGDHAEDCVGPQIDNAMTIMICESDGIPMAVNYSSGTTGLFQHRPSFWPERVARTRDAFPEFPADASPYNPEHNVMVAALLVHESRDALIGRNTLTGPWDDGPEPWGHWDSSSRFCADPPLVNP